MKPTLIISLLGALTLTACEFGKTTIGLGQPTVVIHAVLNPTAAFEEILVEQTLTGAMFVDTSALYDPTNPVSSGGGIPISGATVIVYGPNGDSAIAREGFPSGDGSGVYLIENSLIAPNSSSAIPGMPTLPFAAGRQYRLRVVTTNGDLVTGTTTIPANPAPFDSTTTPHPFDRTRDTLSLTWPHVQSARSYLVQISTPFNTFETLVDTFAYRLPGDARDPDVRTVPHLFIPGFTQIIVVGAMDSNYYDYERFRNDVSTTATRINHLTGGLGVFGAYVPLVFRELSVTAPFTLPIEGIYSNTTLVSNAPSRLFLYVESPAGSNSLAQISGNYVQASGATGALIGVFDGTHVTLDILQGQSTLDTTMVIDGTVNTGTITGTIRQSSGQVTYTKTSP